MIDKYNRWTDPAKDAVALKRLTNGARRVIIRDTIAGIALIIGSSISITTTCITQAAAQSDRWTDTQLCVESYKGLIDYDLAMAGCKSRRLQGLSHREQMAIWERPEWERHAIAASIKNQAIKN